MALPPETIATFLAQTPLLRHLELDELLRLAQGAQQQPVPAKKVILQPGRATATIGLMLKGKASLRLVDAASGSQSSLEPLMPGDLFGDVGLLLGSANPLTVVADENCLVLMVDKQIFEPLMEKSPGLAMAMAKRLASRFVKLSMMGLRVGTSTSQPQLPALEEPQIPQTPVQDPPQKRREGEIVWVEVGTYNLTPEVASVIPVDLIRKHRMLPLEIRGQQLTVGMVNPRSIEAIQDLRRVLHTVDPVVVAISVDDFHQAFIRLKLESRGEKKSQRSASREAPVVYAADLDREAEKTQLIIGNEVIGIFDRLLREALELGASDIHIEPDSTGVRVRYRVQGGLLDHKELVSQSYAAPLLARIKVLAELDITERRMPQDGRITARLGRREINLRVSTMPVARGEKAVVRVIDPGDIMRPLRQIFLHPEQDKAAQRALANPYGAIVVAGPTGSGKSSTLYSMLHERRRARPDTNIVTVEDPVEYMLDGVTQVPVQARVGFDFANALRGLVRQDPDVIMIGELRDSETTSIMVEAALTGHLVLTSMHGNNVSGVLQRLQQVGTDPVLLSQALSLIVVQRLAGRLCPSCVAEGEVAPALLDNLAARRIIERASVTRLPRPVGCEACGRTGYLGRIAVHEMLDVDDEIRVAMAQRATPDELIRLATERKRFASFPAAAAHLMARKMLSPAEALMIVAS